MTSLAALQAQRDALDATIQELQAAARNEAIAKVKAVMDAHGLTLADLRIRDAAGDGKRAPQARGKAGRA